tara:strand:+ start:7832 stop:8131 length:300 start_codon:yes stop_codon:yes gene_type:complete
MLLIIITLLLGLKVFGFINFEDKIEHLYDPDHLKPVKLIYKKGWRFNTVDDRIDHALLDDYDYYDYPDPKYGLPEYIWNDRYARSGGLINASTRRFVNL